MPVPTPAQAILLFFLGGVFLHFLLAGTRTFYTANVELEPGAWIAQLDFVFGGTVQVWLIGLRHPIPLANGIVAAAMLALSIALYEWARQTVWRRRFGIGWGVHVPDAMCAEGPYRYLRHPIYLGYLLAFLSAFIALPYWPIALIFAINVALFVHGALQDERLIATSALAADYAVYRERTGMFFPKLSPTTPVS
jgi:protein-S-isoprenylcysteine O-methyltransferase Ste14